MTEATFSSTYWCSQCQKTSLITGFNHSLGESHILWFKKDWVGDVGNLFLSESLKHAQKTSDQSSAGSSMSRLSLNVGGHCDSMWELSACAMRGCCVCVCLYACVRVHVRMRERESIRCPSSRLTYCLCGYRGLACTNTMSPRERTYRSRKDKTKTQGERRTEAFSLFTVSHGQQLLGHVSTLLTFA